jgi:hypothetical protein
MKKQILSLAATASAAVILTGCASMSSDQVGYDDANMPMSTLAFSPVTDAEELSKWAPHFGASLRSIDTYAFTPPADMMNDTDDLPAYSESLPAGSPFEEAAGAEPRTRRVIMHRPHQR